MKTRTLAIGLTASVIWIGSMPVCNAAEPPSNPTLPAAPHATGPALVDDRELTANKSKAKVAWERDQKTLGAKEFSELEKEYQEINANYKATQVKDLLEKFIAKWKTGNRVGCATLYLGQKSSGEQRETLLKKCAGEFSDCYYLDGTQVGGLGRLFLASYYKQQGKADEAGRLAAEIRKDFPSAQDHSRHRVVELLADLEK